MLDKSAIQELRKDEVIKSIQATLSTTDCPTAVAPDDYSVHNLESFMSGRYRFRGNMRTTSIPAFLAYANERTEVSCFVDAENMSARAFFNLGDQENPGHGDDTASISLKKTAPFNALLGIDGTKRGQKELAEWLEDWREFISFSDSSGVSLSAVQAIGAVRRVTISAKAEQTHEERDFGTSRSAMEEIEANAEDKLPSHIIFNCTPYEGLGERSFAVRLSLLTGEEKPKFSIRIVRLETQEEEMADEFKDLIEAGLNEEIAKVFVGSFTV